MKFTYNIFQILITLQNYKLSKYYKVFKLLVNFYLIVQCITYLELALTIRLEWKQEVRYWATYSHKLAFELSSASLWISRLALD